VYTCTVKTEMLIMLRHRLHLLGDLSGMVTSGCLPVFAFGSFQGVTCIDLPLDTLFSPIIDFRLAQLSYAFLIDSRGRVLLHPLLPKPETYKQEPIFLYMESVEISSETPVIKRSMIRLRLVLVEILPNSAEYNQLYWLIKV